MLNIAIYSNYYADIEALKSIIYTYLAEIKIVAKISVIEDSYKFINKALFKKNKNENYYFSTS